MLKTYELLFIPYCLERVGVRKQLAGNNMNNYLFFNHVPQRLNAKYLILLEDKISQS
jgi:hypothetical protein